MAKKDKILLGSLLASIFVFSLLVAIFLPNNFTISLLASIIGVLLAFCVAYFFVDRYRREKERKERAQRTEIQKDILGQMEEIFIMLVREYAENLNNYLEEPVDLYGEERGDWDKFSSLVEKRIFTSGQIDIGQVDFSDIENFIDSIGIAVRRIAREMQSHPVVLDEIRKFTREFNLFRGDLERCEAIMKRERERKRSGKQSYSYWALENLLRLGPSMIKVVNAISKADYKLIPSQAKD